MREVRLTHWQQAAKTGFGRRLCLLYISISTKCAICHCVTALYDFGTFLYIFDIFGYPCMYFPMPCQGKHADNVVGWTSSRNWYGLCDGGVSWKAQSHHAPLFFVDHDVFEWMWCVQLCRKYSWTSISAFCGDSWQTPWSLDGGRTERMAHIHAHMSICSLEVLASLLPMLWLLWASQLAWIIYYHICR